MGIKLAKVFISNYKSIDKLDFSLMDLNVLFGKNNAGKSTILQAINLGINYLSIDKEEVRNTKDSPFSFNKNIVIDLLFLPNDTDSFDDEWATEFGSAAMSFKDDPEKQFFAFRTIISFDEKRSVFKNEKRIIKEWKDGGKSLISSALVPSFILGNSIQCFYIDANRDISIDLKDKKSYWNKMISKLSIDDTFKVGINKSIEEINTSIKENSASMKRTEEELKKLSSPDFNDISISPLTKDVESLYKGIDIYYSMDDITNIPVEYLGSGTRSQAVFLTHKTQLDMQYETNDTIYTLFLVEEPEAHVHPQDQMRIAEIIKNTKGQKIIATHSPYIVNSFQLSDMVNVFCEGGATNVQRFSADISDKDNVSLNLNCMKYKSEMVFSSTIILVEGQTELLAIPIFYNHYFGKYPFCDNVSIIDVNGKCNYYPFVKVCKELNLKWLILSDGEQETIRSVQTAIQNAYSLDDSYDILSDDRVVFLSNNKFYEDYLVDSGFEDDIVEAINEYEGKDNYFDNEYLTGSSWSQHKSSKGQTFANLQDERKAAMKFYLQRNKTIMAEPVATKICEKRDKTKIPSAIIDVMEKI